MDSSIEEYSVLSEEPPTAPAEYGNTESCPWIGWCQRDFQDPPLSTSQLLFCLDGARQKLREQLQLATENGPLELLLRPCELICLSTDLTLQNRLAAAAAKSGSELKNITCDIEGLTNTANACFLEELTTWETLQQAAGVIQDILEEFECICELNINVDYHADNQSNPFAAILLGQSLRHIKALTIQGARDDEAAWLESCLSNRPLESLSFESFDASLFDMLGRVLPTMPELKICSLGQVFHNVTEPEEIQGLQRILNCQFLDQLTIDAELGNDEAMAAFCASLQTSNLKKLRCAGSTLRGIESEMLARALSMSGLEELSFVTPIHSSFLDAFGRGLASPACQLDELAFQHAYTSESESIGDSLIGDSLAIFLQYAYNWKLSKLTLHLNDWSPAFDAAISSYVRTSHCLRKLRIVITGGPRGSLIASSALLAALDVPGQRLEELEMEDFAGWQRIDVIWQAKMRFILDLQFQQRLHGPRLSKISSANDLVDVLDKIKCKFLFEFLRRNEFNMVQLLQACGGGHGGTSRI